MFGGKHKQERAMSVSEILRKAKHEIVIEIRELRKRHQLELQQKDRIIGALKRQLDRQARPSSKPASMEKKKAIRAKREFSSDNLRKIRGSRGLTQAQAAKLLDVSLPTYCSWESGKNTPRAISIRRITELSQLSDETFRKMFSAHFPGTSLPMKK